MPPSAVRFLPALLLPFFAWRIYARARRNIGLQRLEPRRLASRAMIFVVLTLLIAASCAGHLKLLASLGGGLALGVILSLVGLKLTRFSDSPAGVCYTPNTHIGISLALILAGRILYRLVVFYLASEQGSFVTPSFAQSPLTLFLFGLPAGYYIAYNVGLLRHPRNVR